ncbi:MAG: hypothetical protein ACK5F7_16535, partial [Planctomycetaceae bacterium]
MAAIIQFSAEGRSVSEENTASFYTPVLASAAKLAAGNPESASENHRRSVRAAVLMRYHFP